MSRFRDWAYIFRDASFSHRPFYTPKCKSLSFSSRCGVFPAILISVCMNESANYGETADRNTVVDYHAGSQTAKGIIDYREKFEYVPSERYLMLFDDIP